MSSCILFLEAECWRLRLRAGAELVCRSGADMRQRYGPAPGAWLSALGLAAVCAAALAAWLDPAYALAWVQLMALCR